MSEQELLEQCRRTWSEWSGGEDKMPYYDKEIMVQILTVCAGQLFHDRQMSEKDFTGMIAEAMKAAYNLGKVTR